MPYISGLVLGLSLILPFGPQNLFVLNQGLLSGSRRGLVAVFTAGFCDTILIVSGAAGLSATLTSLPWLRTGLLTVGAIFLLLLGLRSLLGQKEAAGATSPSKTSKMTSLYRVIFTGVAVSWGNPHKILDTIAVLGSTVAAQAAASRVAFAAGGISASWVFFLVLVLVGAWCGTWFTATTQVWIRRISGVMMLIFAGLLGCEAIASHLVIG